MIKFSMKYAMLFFAEFTEIEIYWGYDKSKDVYNNHVSVSASAYKDLLPLFDAANLEIDELEPHPEDHNLTILCK